MARKTIKLAKPIKLAGAVDLKKSVNPGHMSQGKVPGMQNMNPGNMQSGGVPVMKGKVNLKKMPRGRF